MSEFKLNCFKLANKKMEPIPFEGLDKGFEQWVHIEGEAAEIDQWLRQHVNLTNEMVKALVSKETRTRVIQENGDLLVVLKDILIDEENKVQNVVSLRHYISSNFIISINLRPSNIIYRLEEENCIGSRVELLIKIVSMILSKTGRLLDCMDDALDEIDEAELKDEKNFPFAMISQIRSNSVILKRYLIPLKDVMFTLLNGCSITFTKNQKSLFQNQCDEVLRQVDNIVLMNERGSILNDEIRSCISEKANRNLYIFSLYAALFLPLTFLTGLFGVNLGGIPGGEVSHAFGIFSALMIVVMVANFFIFKFFKWI